MRKVRTIEMKRLTVEEYQKAELVVYFVLLILSVWNQSGFVVFAKLLHLLRFIRLPWVLRRV